MLNFLEAYLSCTEFDACSLQPINGASGEHAGLLVSKYQESIGQDLGMKSAHGTNTDSAVMPHIDEISQSLEMYNTMHQTTENELEAKDQITEQDNKYARNKGPKVENEKLSVKMRLTKAICWSHAKSEDDARQSHTDARERVGDLRGTENQAPDTKEGASNQRKA